MIRRRDPLSHPEPLIRRVYAYAMYRLGNESDAEDVTNETFERALRYRASYDRSKGEPITWLLGIARRCTDAALAPGQETLGDVPEKADGTDLEQRAVTRLTLAGALASLSVRDRELIALRYGADLTAAEVGDRLGLATNATEVALHRALGRLRANLGLPDETRGEVAVRVSVPGAISFVDRASEPTGEAA